MDVHSPKNGINRYWSIPNQETQSFLKKGARWKLGNTMKLWRNCELRVCFLRAFLNRFSLTYSSTSAGIEGELVVGVCRLCKRFYAKFLDIWFKAQLCQPVSESKNVKKTSQKKWRSYFPRSLTTSTRRCNSKEPIAIFVLGQLSHVGLWNFGRPEGSWNGPDSEQTRRLHRLSEQRWTDWVGYGSIPIDTIFSGMNIHLPAILGFTRYQGFDPSPVQCLQLAPSVLLYRSNPPLSGLMAGWGLCWWPSCRDGTAAW